MCLDPPDVCKHLDKDCGASESGKQKVAPERSSNEWRLGEPPLRVVDIGKTPSVKQRELGALLDALCRYNLARRDYEMKLATIRLRLLQLARVQEGEIELTVEPDGKMIFVENSTSPPLRHTIPAD